MQVKKDSVKEEILISAGILFHKKGYTGTSMRSIATNSNIGLSNIYNYFSNKDDIFKAIIEPSITKLIKLHNKLHNPKTNNSEILNSDDYFKKIITKYTTLIITNRKNYELLFFESQGTSFEKFKEEFIIYTTQQSIHYFMDVKTNIPHSNINISDFFVKRSISSMFKFVEKLIINKVKKKDLKSIIEEYLKFNTIECNEFTKPLQGKLQNSKLTTAKIY